MSARPEECQCCRRLGYLSMSTSLIDGYQYAICASCIRENAVTFVEIANWMREHEWSDLPLPIRTVVTVWMDERYMPVLDAMKRMLHQQLVPCPPADPEIELCAEDEELFQSMLRKIRQLGLYLDDGLPPPRRRGMLERVRLFFATRLATGRFAT